MSLRVSKRFRVGKSTGINLSKGGVSVSKRTRHGSVGIGRGGVRGSVRLIRGVSWLWGKRR